MQADYQAFTMDELARDDQFRRWVLERDPAAEQFWLMWLAQHPDNGGKIQLARAFLLALEEQDTALPPPVLADITDGIVQADRGRVVSLWRRTAFQVAASVLLLAGVGYVGYRVTQPTDGQEQTRLRQISPALADQSVRQTNGTDTVQFIRLEDGSAVRLYPNSTLRYPAQFAEAKREIFLSGKAFFHVARNPRKPFWVYTSTLSTQVLGTQFMVSAFAEATQAKVAVTSGRVSVYRLSDVERARRDGLAERAGVILTANQQVAYSRTDERLVKAVVDQPAPLQPRSATAFVFEETPIAEVFALLEKTYGLPVLYDAATMSRCYLTANLTDEALFDKLALICKITRSSYEIVDGQIVIHSNGCDAIN